MKNKLRVETRLIPFFMLLLGMVTVSPLVLMFISSLKDDRFQITADLGSLRAFFVSDPSLNNYLEIMAQNSNYLRFFLNSLIIMSGTVIGTLLISSTCAFILLRGRFRFKKTILLAILSLYIIPQEAIMLPMLFEAVKMNLLDTYIIQILPFVASPLYIFLFYQFFKEIPPSMAEAAQIDGAGLWVQYFRIYLPLSKPAIVTVVILQGMESWNQYLWPLLVTQSENVRPLTVAIASYFSNSEIYWDRLFAASVLMMLPILALYLVFQKYFIASIVTSGIK